MLNHTSEEHAWFKESRSSLDNPKRDWYHWAKGTVDPVTGAKKQPNNWESIFQGKAWEYDEHTDEWYLHMFVKQQPDLNWENPEVREALFEIARFWLDKGCDGFRLDAVQFCSKPVGYTDAEIVQEGYLQPCVKHVAHGPKIHEYMKAFGEVLSGELPTEDQPRKDGRADSLALFKQPTTRTLSERRLGRTTPRCCWNTSARRTRSSTPSL